MSAQEIFVRNNFSPEEQVGSYVYFTKVLLAFLADLNLAGDADDPVIKIIRDNYARDHFALIGLCLQAIQRIQGYSEFQFLQWKTATGYLYVDTMGSHDTWDEQNIDQALSAKRLTSCDELGQRKLVQIEKEERVEIMMSFVKTGQK